MGASAVHSDLPVSFKAPTQVLLFSSDGAAMDFFSKNNSNLLKSEEVYICLNSMRADAVNTNNVFVFSMADICAQLYWEEHPVLSAQKISVVGSGSCAESILTQGLLVNLYDFEGGVEYLVVGDFAEYLSLHRSLDDAFLTNKDILKITFEPWYDCVNELADYERIILCDLPDENLKVASALRNGMVKTPIDLRADSGSCLDLMGERSDIEVFGTTDQLCTRAIVL